jgi:DNA primase catalytic subunit
MEETSFKEERIRKITQLYYSKKEVQKAIFEFSKKRETIPRYFEGFGKRPDSLEYPGDIFELAKKGATSFHCSIELWKDPLKISTDLSEEQANQLRENWDLLIDIDSKYIDYSKVMAELIINVLKFHGVKNVGIKFSGSKGFHILVPHMSFPEEVNGIKTSNMFPIWPRIITKYLLHTIDKDLVKEISNLQKPNKYIRDVEASKEVIPDLVLVSPRHLFRVPYSLHEKTSLASVVISPDKIKDFELKDADPNKVKIRDFMPESKKGEAKELLVAALDWAKDNLKENETKATGKYAEFKPIKLDNILEENFPPSIQKLLQGISDGKKRGLFVLLNFFRSIGMDKEELEKRIEEWNKKNKPSLKRGYIVAQLLWGYKNKPVLPPNFDKDYYNGIGIIPTEEELRFKNPVNYMIKKSLSGQRTKSENKPKK